MPLHFLYRPIAAPVVRPQRVRPKVILVSSLLRAHARRSLGLSDLLPRPEPDSPSNPNHPQIPGADLPTPVTRPSVDRLTHPAALPRRHRDRKSTRLNSSHVKISYAV